MGAVLCYDQMLLFQVQGDALGKVMASGVLPKGYAFTQHNCIRLDKQMESELLAILHRLVAAKSF